MNEGEGSQPTIPQPKGKPEGEVRSRFNVVDALGEQRAVFHDVFSRWVVDDEGFKEDLNKASDEVRQAFSQIINDDEGKPRSRESVIADYTGFVASKAGEAVNAIQQIRSEIGEKLSKE